MYREIIFLQGEDATETLKALEQHGEERVFNYLLHVYDDGEGEQRETHPAGTTDTVCTFGKYSLSYNLKRGYVGLVEKL